MISVKETLHIGKRIEIAKNTSESKKYYTSQVLNIREKSLSISGPIYRQNLVMMHEGEEIKISYTIEYKGRYTFNALILKRSYKDIYKLEIRQTSAIKKDQRRGFYRFKISLPVHKESITKNEIKFEECITEDISGSGLKLYSNLEHNVGDIIKCRFKVKDHVVENKCQVVRIKEIDNLDYKYSLGVEFIKLNEIDRDSIVKFIFLEERLLREKELM